MPATRVPPHVVIVGGGLAGLETTFLVHHRLGAAVRLTLVSEHADFVFRQALVHVPFGLDPASLVIPLAGPTGRQGMTFVQDKAVGVDPAGRTLHLRSGQDLTFDRLVIATGAEARPQEIAGLTEHAQGLATPEDFLSLRERLERVVDRGRRGESSRLVFVVPRHDRAPETVVEMAFLVEAWLRRHDARNAVDIALVTAEGSWLLGLSGPAEDVLETELASRGIMGWKGQELTWAGPRQTRYAWGGIIDHDLLVASAPRVARTRWQGLDADERGFLRTEGGHLQASGAPGIYVVGSASDFPLQQSHLALLQADAVANELVAQVRAAPGAGAAPFRPVSQLVLDQLDQAIFVQAPLRRTGDPARPVEVDPTQADVCKVGVSPVWRVGRKLVNVYLPMRFRAGEPFHAGAAWGMLDAGLHGMAAVLAH